MRRSPAFTLVELLVSMSILLLMLIVLLQMTNQTATTWHAGAAKAEQFTEARKAFESMTGRISHATLNTYWDYAYDSAAASTVVQGGLSTNQTALATDYVRQSDLRFRVVNLKDESPKNEAIAWTTHGIFFQAPFGVVDDSTQLGVLDDLLNSWGYFVEIADTNERLPGFLSKSYPPRYRSRLMEFRQPAEQFTLYKTLSAKLTAAQKAGTAYPSRDPAVDSKGKVTTDDDKWFFDPMNISMLLPDANKGRRPVRVLAENIIALAILPRLSPEDEQRRATDSTIPVNRQLLTPDFTYHSKQTSNYIPAPTASDIAQSTNAAATYGAINPKNQVPPIVQVAMFALDESSAERLARAEGSTLGMKALLTGDDGDLFTDSSHLETSPKVPQGGDLQALEQKLIDKKIGYRLFTTNIALKGAKWSSATTK